MMMMITIIIVYIIPTKHNFTAK